MNAAPDGAVLEVIFKLFKTNNNLTQARFFKAVVYAMQFKLLKTNNKYL
jgi:hypothetical protein